MALPFERTEAILEGMVAAFDFFGCVPGEVWWDNPKTVATLILQGRERRLHPRYAALAGHYAFDPHFCMPARGNEKPDAESTVKAVQRRFATPVPKVAGLDELNTFFRDRCEAERRRTVQSLFGPFVIADRFTEEIAAAGPLPRTGSTPARSIRRSPLTSIKRSLMTPIVTASLGRSRSRWSRSRATSTGS